MEMNGKEIFRRAVTVMVESARDHPRAAAGVDCRRHRPRRPPPGQHPHHRGGLPAARASAAERVSTVLHATGNTSAASIPLALADALDDGRIAEGDLVLLVGFGAGMSWASTLLRWEGRVTGDPT